MRTPPSNTALTIEELGAILRKKDITYRETFTTSLEDLHDIDSYMNATVMEQAEVTEEIQGELCTKCGKYSVISYQVQVRSGDEGTNTLHRCTNKSCRNSFITK